jgi:hypothetical protein
MSDLPATLSLKKLPVWATIREAFGFAWDHRYVLWRWIVAGAFITGLGDLVGQFSYGEEGWGLTGFPYFAAILLTPIPGLLVFVLLAVYCHRTFLIYHGGKDLEIKFFFTERERKFFAWVIGVPLGAILLIFPGFLAAALIFGQISEMYQGNFLESSFVLDLLFNVMILFPLYYLLGRWILVFPAIAIDQEPKLGWSWKQTKGNSWRMFILVGFLPMTVGNLWYLLSFVGLSEFPVSSSFLTSFLLFLFTPVEVAVISIAFRELTNWTPSSQLSEST